MAYGNRVPQTISRELPPPSERVRRAVYDRERAVEHERAARRDAARLALEDFRRPVEKAPDVLRTAAALSNLPAAAVSAIPMVKTGYDKIKEQGWDVLDDPGFQGAMLLGLLTRGGGRGTGKIVRNESKASFPRSVAKEVTHRREFNASRAGAIETAKKSVTEASKRYSQADVDVQAAWQDMKKVREARSFSNYDLAARSHETSLTDLEKAGGDLAVAREALRFARDARYEPANADVAAWLARRGRRNRAYDETIWPNGRNPPLPTVGEGLESFLQSQALHDVPPAWLAGKMVKGFDKLASGSTLTLGPRFVDLLFPKGAWNATAKRTVGVATLAGEAAAIYKFGPWREKQKADTAKTANKQDYAGRTNRVDQVDASAAGAEVVDIPDASKTTSFSNAFGL